MKKIIKFLILFIIILTASFNFKNIKVNEEKVNNEVEPLLKVKLSSKVLQQGEYLKIIFNNVNNHSLKVESNIAEASNNEVYLSGSNAYAFIPVMIAKPKGSYYVKIYDNNKLINNYDVSVIEKDFEIQKLTISDDVVKDTHNAEAIRLYNEAIKKARSYNYKERYFEDVFTSPATGRISTEFGVKRYVNNSLTPTRHYGIDIANDKGTVVKAFASGMITYADFLPSGGNYIVIDHGMGLYSYYAHLDRIKVKELTKVKQGEIIGYMGTTGFSTGSHLHFALTFKGIYVNPWLFIKREEVSE